jgi:hypothetical protein
MYHPWRNINFTHLRVIPRQRLPKILTYCICEQSSEISSPRKLLTSVTSSPGSPHHPGCAHLFTRFRTGETTVPRCITVAEWELDYRCFIPPAPAPGNPHFVLANRSLKVSSSLGIAHLDYLESLTILEALTYPQGFEPVKYCGFEVSRAEY